MFLGIESTIGSDPLAVEGVPNPLKCVANSTARVLTAEHGPGLKPNRVRFSGGLGTSAAKRAMKPDSLRGQQRAERILSGLLLVLL